MVRLSADSNQPGVCVGTVLKLNDKGSDPGPRAAEAAFERLRELVADDMAIVNQTILERMKSPVALIPELAGHLIASGGKRLRPLLTLATSKLLGFQGQRQTQLAACVEFIHTATLLHDDVVDGSFPPGWGTV